MIRIDLSWWMRGEQLTKLTQAARIWWSRLESWVTWPLAQLNEETCALSLLDLIAWSRGIERFTKEPERQYRLRVRYAYANFKDAGSNKGFEAIFRRLEMGAITINERVPGLDFDVIQLTIDNRAIANNDQYLNWLVNTYGRTCRRYQWKLVDRAALGLGAAHCGCDYATFYCQ